MAVRAVRGATQLEVDEREHLLERVAELVREVLRRNALTNDDLISIIFTATADVRSEFPAYAARLMGMTDVPLLCARELEIEGSMPRVVRLLAHVETDLTRDQITHVYLHGAAALRRDLTHVYAAPDEPDAAPEGRTGVAGTESGEAAGARAAGGERA
ncbi:chorismate mutase [Thermasporomyces composti]|uniref:chorismate mutase n=1 Tax=Thermasporomyces composti TaxID=696763 RepID=A0A3D9V9T0_THECX|nr:chorismate mutase [Thermasporomyces composti]REF38046.1 chorismate mutase [Thermasporomyces composti]